MAMILCSAAIAVSTSACALDQDPASEDTTTEDLTIAAATSSSIVRTDGTRAGEAFFNPGSNPFIDLFDAKCDNHQVYVEWWINGGFATRNYNGGGCNTTVRITLPRGGYQINYRAFVDVPLATDPSGNIAVDRN